MSDIDLTDSIDLRALRTAYGEAVLPPRPPLLAIVSRGRALRRRRRQGAATVASAVAVATAATLALGSTTSDPARTAGHASSQKAALFTARTAAYTIVSNANGTATFTISPSELFDPTRLQQDLARAGVPALVTMGEFCTSYPSPAGFSQAVSYVVKNNNGPDQPDAGGSSTITIDPGAFPAGVELSVGDIPIHDAMYSGVRLVSVALIDKEAHSCSSAAATDSPTGSPPEQLRFAGIPGK